MAAEWWRGSTSRMIKKRILLKGKLVLDTPAHVGNGDGDVLTDMPLFVDPYDGKTPILYGASLAGALRAYLAGRLGPANWAEVERLFGAAKGNDAGEQSPLIVDDARGKLPDGAAVEQRTGVGINPRSRTAEEDRLFEIDLWPAGTTFDLRLELVIRKRDNEADLKNLLATALAGLDDGGVTLGARKTRGWGRVKTSNWRVKEFDLTTPDGLLDWIEKGDQELGKDAPVHQTAQQALSANIVGKDTPLFRIEAQFALSGSLLVRWVGDVGDPDAIHLSSWRGRKRVPILPGTSLAGALRARARRIVNTLAPGGKGLPLVDDVFGPMLGEGTGTKVAPRASRLIVEETVVQEPVDDLVQTRVSIDRFTGGTRHGALFTEQPVFAKEETTVRVVLTLRDPEDWEIGLLLLLLKDLWTEDLPVGGEASVGRGRLRGREAKLLWQQGDSSITRRIVQHDQHLRLEGDTPQQLEAFVSAFGAKLEQGVY